MSDRALIQNMLMRNALYNDGVGSTNGAGLYNRRAGAGYIGGAKYNRQRGGARLGGAMLGGCHMCQSGECMNCGSGYVGGFVGENLLRREIKARRDENNVGLTLAERREAFQNFLEAAENKELAAEYTREKEHRRTGRKNYLEELAKLKAKNMGLSLPRLRRLYKEEHPKPKRVRKAKAPRKPRAPGKPRQLKGCNPNMPEGLYAYCEYVKGYKLEYPGSTAADARAAWHAGVQLA